MGNNRIDRAIAEAGEAVDRVALTAKVEERADDLYNHYGTFDRAIAVASRDVATAKTLDDVVFYARVLVKLEDARIWLGVTR